MAKYNPTRINGKDLSPGLRSSEERYNAICEFCKQYKRPISVLDLGAAEDYFTVRLSEDFRGVFIAVESDKKRKLKETFEKNNKNTLLLETKLNLKDLKRIKEIEHFDVILALNVVHHFDEEFNSVLNTLMTMCSFCFFEHPHEDEGSRIINNHRLKKERLQLDKYSPIKLVSTHRQPDKYRDMFLLKSHLPHHTIDRKWSGGKKYPQGKEIKIYSDFDSCHTSYATRQEEREWHHGLSLQTFYEYGGTYPIKPEVEKMLLGYRKGEETLNDFSFNNIILTGKALELIDQGENQMKRRLKPKDLVKRLYNPKNRFKRYKN